MLGGARPPRAPAPEAGSDEHVTAPGSEPLVVFTPSGRRGRFPAGTGVLDAARTLGVDIDSVCGGRGLCGRCQVTQAVGDFPKHGLVSAPNHLSENRDAATEYGERNPLPDGRRLACTAHLLGDAVIDVPPESQVHRQVVRKELGALARPLEVDPVLRLHLVEVAPADLASPRGDLARLTDALAREWGLTGLTADLPVIAGLHAALDAGAGRVTAAVHGGTRITAVWPGFRDAAVGVAVDVGSTTIAGHLADLADGRVLASRGVMNPQIRFGEDLMSRVSYAMLHADGAREMTAAVREALRKLILGLASAAGLKATDVLEVVLVGNPVMHHLVLGLDPVPLGTAPFTLATDEAVEVRAAELDLGVHPGARAYLLPCIAGHVGADTAGVILAERPHEADRVTLIVDVGTNAELVLGDRRRLLAASSPTGPAFEGAQISAGQRAAPGAIERVRIDRDTLEPRIKVIGAEAWSDEPGFAEAVAATGITGICGSGIVEVIAELYLAGGITQDGVIDGAAAARSPRIVADGRTWSYVLHEGTPRITVTQNDVRAIQLAKAALYAGAQLLMTQLGVERVEEVRLAGAFGSQIDPLHAMVLGLIPDCDLADVKAVGNAAGVGALMALLSRSARAEIERVARAVDKIETAVEPRFQDEFVGALGIPHRSAPFPRLASVVALPERRMGDDDGGGAARPRRRRATAVTAAQEEAR
jgi:uncharacterized 2Fe-2S/4Fe-4S cluster protein (DUF4445 family)